MLALFRRNVFFTQLLLLPYIFLVRAMTLFEPMAFVLPEKSNIFQKTLFLNIQQALPQNIIANLLIFIQALIVNSLVVKHRLSRENTLFTAVAYILFVSFLPENVLLSPVIVANTFILLALYQILNTYKVQTATVYMFNAGLFLSLASIFYAPYFTFFLFGVFAFLQLRSFRFLELLQYIAGFVTPFILLFTYRYWNNIVFYDKVFIADIIGYLPQMDTKVSAAQWVGVSIILVSTIAVIVLYGSITGRKNIQIQKKNDIIYWVLFFCLVSFFAFQSTQFEHLLTLGIPLSFLTGILVSESPSRLFFEFVHLLMLAGIVIINFVLL